MNVWYGPVRTVASNNVIGYSVNIKVPARTALHGTLKEPIPVRFSYSGTCKQALALCVGDSGGGWDSEYHYTANYVVPSLCQIDSTSNVDFGNINDIGKTTRDYTAQGGGKYDL